MTDALLHAYPWIKSAHIIAMVSWMAALLYLPRLFAYHADADPESETATTLALMERRLLQRIMTPAMVLTWGFGLLLVLTPGLFAGGVSGWFAAKLALVLLLTGFHGLCGRWRKDLEANRNRRSSRFYRIANEIPTVLLIGIVILVVVRPF